jgi:hypothetical protein
VGNDSARPDLDTGTQTPAPSPGAAGKRTTRRPSPKPIRRVSPPPQTPATRVKIRPGTRRGITKGDGRPRTMSPTGRNPRRERLSPARRTRRRIRRQSTTNLAWAKMSRPQTPGPVARRKQRIYTQSLSRRRPRLRTTKAEATTAESSSAHTRRGWRRGSSRAPRRPVWCSARTRCTSRAGSRDGP